LNNDRDAEMSKPTQDKTQFQIKILRGGTKFPQRPVDHDRYLIGGGSNCHLQLGGEIAILHSILVQQNGSIWIDAVVSEPALIVNGNQVRETELHHGDIVDIGLFRFEIEQSDSIVTDDPQESEPIIGDATAEQLVDRIDEELKKIATRESAQAAGAEALLQAIAGAGIESGIEGTVSNLEADHHELLEQLEVLTRGITTGDDDDSPDLKLTA